MELELVLVDAWVSLEQCCGAGACTFWPEPVQRSPGSGSTIDKTDEILNDILFVSSHIDKMLPVFNKRLFKKQILINK